MVVGEDHLDCAGLRDWILQPVTRTMCVYFDYQLNIVSFSQVKASKIRNQNWGSRVSSPHRTVRNVGSRGVSRLGSQRCASSIDYNLPWLASIVHIHTARPQQASLRRGSSMLELFIKYTYYDQRGMVGLRAEYERPTATGQRSHIRCWGFHFRVVEGF